MAFLKTSLTTSLPPPWFSQKRDFVRLFEEDSGCRLQEGGWMGCQAQAPHWDKCLISFQDGWHRRRLIMPCEKWWERKSVWKSEVHLRLGMKAPLRHCVKALGLSFEAYCIYSMRITALRQSPKRSKKFISWALAILSDECDSCAVRANSYVCACVCACARVQSNAYHLALSRRGFLIWKKWSSPLYTHTCQQFCQSLCQLVNCTRGSC